MMRRVRCRSPSSHRRSVALLASPSRAGRVPAYTVDESLLLPSWQTLANQRRAVDRGRIQSAKPVPGAAAGALVESTRSRLRARCTSTSALAIGKGGLRHPSVRFWTTAAILCKLGIKADVASAAGVSFVTKSTWLSWYE